MLTSRTSKAQCPLCRTPLNSEDWLAEHGWLHILDYQADALGSLQSMNWNRNNRNSSESRPIIIHFGHEPIMLGATAGAPCLYVRMDSRSPGRECQVIRQVRFFLQPRSEQTEGSGSDSPRQLHIALNRPPFELPFDEWPDSVIDVAIELQFRAGRQASLRTELLSHQIRPENRERAYRRSLFVDTSNRSTESDEAPQVQLRRLREVQQQTTADLLTASNRLADQRNELTRRLDALRAGPTIEEVMRMNQAAFRPAAETREQPAGPPNETSPLAEQPQDA